MTKLQDTRTAALLRLASALVVALVLAGCTGITATPIGDVLKSPKDFDGKAIVIKGTVNSSANLVIVKYYVVNDGTGDLTVLTDGGVPNPGDKVRVKGTVDQAFAFQGHSIVVLHEKISGS